MNSFELIGSKSSPLCHMFDSDRLLSDSNDDSDDHSSDKYHTLDQLDSYDTLELENNLINCHNNSLNHNINDNTNSITINANINNQNIINNNQNNKRKCLESNGINNNTNNGNQKRVPPPNGKKTKGRVKIKMEFIDNKLRRYTTFSKRKTGIMKKAYELSTLTGTQVMLLVASETGHVYTFATRKLQPMITSDAGKALIQTCLNSPDPNSHIHCGDQRMSATGFEETDLTYSVNDDSPNDKSDDSCPPSGQCQSSGGSSDNGSDSPELLTNVINNNSSATTYAQLENALPLNYLTEANLISNKLASRQLISQLTNNNVLSSSSSVSNSSSSSVTSSATMTNSGTISNASKLGTIASNKSINTTIHNAITSLPTMSHTSAQQLLNAGNILLCANGNQISLPSQSSQSSISSPSTTTPTLMYNPTQGVVYATASGGPNNSLITDGLILNLGQNHNNGTEFLINNNTFSQLQLQQKPSPAIVKREGIKKQRTKQ